MCTIDCRTFLWGGEGLPMFSEGQCWCECENNGWSNLNLLGRPSCVPMKAHHIFAGVGLAVCMITLGHVVYHLRRQVRFHAEQPAASASPVEKCRRDMHFAIICSCVAHSCYVSMVLGGALRWSVVFLCGAQIPTGAGALLAMRMWISTNDPRLLRESPEVLAVSSCLQSSTGQIAGYSLVSIHAAVSAAVAFAGYTETAARIMATGDGCQGLTFAVAFWYCGKFLLVAIDRSLQRSSASEGSGGTRNLALLKAREKVVKVISFFVQQCVMASLLLFFSAFSKYGREAPLLLFCIPFIMPVAWSMVGTQLFAGRSKLRSTPPRSPTSGFPTSGGMSRPTSPTDWLKGAVSRSHQQQVVPIETSTVPC